MLEVCSPSSTMAGDTWSQSSSSSDGALVKKGEDVLTRAQQMKSVFLLGPLVYQALCPLGSLMGLLQNQQSLWVYIPQSQQMFSSHLNVNCLEMRGKVMNS